MTQLNVIFQEALQWIFLTLDKKCAGEETPAASRAKSRAQCQTSQPFS